MALRRNARIFAKEVRMSLQSNMRRLADEVTWQVRGVFASEQNRRLAFRARALFQPAEMRARARAATQLASKLDPSLRIADADGFLQLPAASIPDTSTIAATGREIASNLVASKSGPGGKSFHRNQLADEVQRRALLSLALDPAIVAMASDYLGVLPVLCDLDYFMSMPSPAPWKKSQLWHCDDDAPRQLKIFLYCDDVGDDNGPFEMIRASDSTEARTSLGYRYAGRRYRVADSEMDAHVPRSKQLSVKGARGSAFVVDTGRCFHKGSRIVLPERRRMVAVALYCTPNGMKLPLRLSTRTPGPYASLATGSMSSVERAVLGFPLV